MGKPLMFLTMVLLSGCSTFGDSEFACSSGEGDAMCGSSRAILKATDGPMAENDAITIIKDGEVVETKGGQNITSSSTSSSTYTVTPSAPLTHYRAPGQVIRIWIAPWVDSADNLHLASTVLSDVRPRAWQVADQTLLRPQTAFGSSLTHTQTTSPVVSVNPAASKADHRPGHLDFPPAQTQRSLRNLPATHAVQH